MKAWFAPALAAVAVTAVCLTGVLSQARPAARPKPANALASDARRRPAPHGRLPARVKSKIVNLHYCPMTMEAVRNSGTGGLVAYGYRIQFCCDGCPQMFAALSPAQKKAKLAAVVAHEKAAGRPS